ncbi:MAG: right-handed parallel beta-helix repeat-containing protein [Armatimonadota bacterium]|nr:right-handed parallel beta-helix repeat-containing protein [Armatimonadota bacterium]
MLVVLMAALVLELLACPQVMPAQTEATAQRRVLEVDRDGSGAYQTLREVAAAAQPGDTIRLKPKSGPYREELYVRASGTAAAPITIDGGGNLITGFEPLTGFVRRGDAWVCRLPVPFPCVLTYRGERLLQDTKTGQFMKYATLNEAQDTITLLPGVEPTDWEISTRLFAVRIANVSHHIYKNIRASGSLNDGFNLHGTGTNLIFENIEGFHNLDEGFSAHDHIASTVRGGQFWGNDNGIGNIADSQTVAEDIDCRDNLGWGIWLSQCTMEMKRVRIWGNGVTQLLLNKADVTCADVTVYTPSFMARPWVSYMESKKATFSLPYINHDSTMQGTPPVIRAEPAPPEAEGTAQPEKPS